MKIKTKIYNFLIKFYFSAKWHTSKNSLSLYFFFRGIFASMSFCGKNTILLKFLQFLWYFAVFLLAISLSSYKHYRNVDHAFWSHALLPKSSTRAKPIPHSWLRHSWGIGSALVDDLVITHGFAMHDHHIPIVLRDWLLCICICNIFWSYTLDLFGEAAHHQKFRQKCGIGQSCMVWNWPIIHSWQK